MVETAICVYCRDLIYLEEEIFVAVGEKPDHAATEERYAHAGCAPPRRRRNDSVASARLERSQVS